MDQVKNRSGQAVIEYILLLSVIVSLYSLVINLMSSSNAFTMMKKPLEKDFAYTYRYGHPKARGQENGGPKYIPQVDGGQNFRIFINPPINE